MTARAVDGREATCEWKVGSSVMFLILDIVNIKHKHFNAPSQVYAESLWLTGLFLITSCWNDKGEDEELPNFKVIIEHTEISCELWRCEEKSTSRLTVLPMTPLYELPSIG